MQLSIRSAIRKASISCGVYAPFLKLRRMALRPEDHRWYQSHRAMLSKFVEPGDLTFDVGANRGSRTEMLLSLGCRVVAFEPQPDCASMLRSYRGKLTVVQKALSEKPGHAILYLKRFAVHASFSKSWGGDTSNIGAIDVEVTTLDAEIARYGVPRYCKIDVEGHEESVFRGLSTPIPVVSFEYFADRLDDAKACLAHLRRLGNYDVNVTSGVKAGFVGEWAPIEEFDFSICACADQWGDFFAVAVAAPGKPS